MAINSGSIFVNKEAAPLSGMPLESLFNDYNKVMSRMPKLTQKFKRHCSKHYVLQLII